MSGFLYHTNASANCPHGGQVTTPPTNTRVLVSGQPVATLSDTSIVAGCPFVLPNGKPQPCMTLKWLVPATRVQVNGQPVLLQTSTGLCQSAEQIPQGPPIIASTQPRVMGM